eukprot:1355440-Pleurochrysis_carterae.AAC.1
MYINFKYSRGAHASLKQNCGKFKAAGDGLQTDTLAKRGGYAVAFRFCGDSRLSSVKILGYCKPISPLHQRCAAPFHPLTRPVSVPCVLLEHAHFQRAHIMSRMCLLLFVASGLQGGDRRVAWDNLYTSTEIAYELAKGCTVEITPPFGGGQAYTVQLPPILTLDTLRGNRGVDKSNVWVEVRGEALKEFKETKSIVARTKCSVFDESSAAAVMVLNICDNRRGGARPTMIMRLK